MKIIHNKMTGLLSLEDHVFNDAMETAAQHCEDIAHTMFSMGADEDGWSNHVGRRMKMAAQEFRNEKRKSGAEL